MVMVVLLMVVVVVNMRNMYGVPTCRYVSATYSACPNRSFNLYTCATTERGKQLFSIVVCGYIDQ